jgi:hypothetical protein
LKEAKLKSKDMDASINCLDIFCEGTRLWKKGFSLEPYSSL